MTLDFRKMNGCGNDFIIIDQRGGAQALDPELIRNASNRESGIGCDQFIVIEPSDEADIFMRIYNANATEAQACGNATRCVAHIHMTEQGTDSCSIKTLGGILKARLVGENIVEVDMGEPQFNWQDIPLSHGVADPLNLNLDDMGGVAVGMGNPHCVFFVEDLEAEDLDLAMLGEKYEHDPLFPEHVNVEFVQVLTPNKVRLRTWERSEGFTQACGSAACATVTAGFLKGLTEPKLEVIMDGGTLNMQYRQSDKHVLMSGPIEYEFDGRLT